MKLSDRGMLRRAARGCAVNPARHASWTAGLLLAVQLTAGVALAQTNVDGSIYGSGTKGATVTVTNRATGYRLTSKVNPDGTFSFPSVPIGEYEVVETLPDGASLQEIANVQIGRGAGVIFANGKDPVALGGVTVTGKKLRLVDTTSSDSGYSVTGKEIEKLPIARDLNSVTQLTPGAVAGATTFPGGANLPSFGGSTVAENVYYLNGFDISDLRTRLAPSTIPFEFFQDFQTKTGGYSAEFGRATGGAVNIVSKRGTNEWEFGVNTFFEPDLGDNHKQITYTDGSATRVWYDPSLNHSTSLEYNVFAGGPVIKNHLFVYGIAAFSNDHDDYINPGGGALNERKRNDPFYAGKIDWQIIDGQLLEATLIRDARTNVITSYTYDPTVPAPQTGQAVGTDFTSASNTREDRGGTIQIYRYTGHFFDDLTVSGLYGYLNSNLTDPINYASCPFIDVANQATVDYDRANYNSLPRQGFIGCNSTGNDLVVARDSRKQYRADVAYAPDWLTTPYTGSHSFKAGFDAQANRSANSVQRTGGFRYTYQFYNAGDELTNGSPAPADDIYIDQNYYNNSGVVKEKLRGIYVEDTISFSNRLTGTVGFRQDKFKELKSDGTSLLDLTTPFAPRLGIAFDVLGNGGSKLFANYGRYYTPLATQVTVRNGNSELNYTDVFEYGGTNSGAPNYTPALGAQVGDRVTFSDGRIKDSRTLVSPSVKPTYSDEISAGYQTDLPQLFDTGGAGAGIRFIYRKLGRTIEDSALDAGLNKYFAANPGQANLNADGSYANGFDYYFITNPGEAATVFLDTDAAGAFCNPNNGNCTPTGNLKSVTLPADLLGYVKPKRKYYAVETTFERIVPGKYRYQASYTWSQSYGNYEGPVNSTIGQADIGITQDFDQPGFLDGAYGKLYGDRRHSFKLFGSYNVTPEFDVGANFFLLSGRPTSVYAFHPTDDFAQAYGAFSFYDNTGRIVQRGSAGKTPWVRQLDLSMHYVPQQLHKHLVVGLDLINVLDYGSYYSKVETQALSPTTRNADGTFTPGDVDPTYGLPLQFQQPRSVRLSLSYKFGLKDLPTF